MTGTLASAVRRAAAVMVWLVAAFFLVAGLVTAVGGGVGWIDRYDMAPSGMVIVGLMYAVLGLTLAGIGWILWPTGPRGRTDQKGRTPGQL